MGSHITLKRIRITMCIVCTVLSSLGGIRAQVGISEARVTKPSVFVNDIEATVNCSVDTPADNITFKWYTAEGKELISIYSKKKKPNLNLWEHTVAYTFIPTKDMNKGENNDLHCKAETTTSSSVGKLSIEVYVAPTGPYFKLPKSVNTYKISNINCRTSFGYPEPKLKWTLNNHEIEGEILVSSHKDATFSVVNALNYKFRSLDNQKFLSCILIHPLVNRSVNYVIRVHNAVSVIVDSNPINVREKESIVLKCNISSELNILSIGWIKNGHPINNSSRISIGYSKESTNLKIKDIIANDTGAYSCIAANAIGKVKSPDIQLIVTFKPKVKIRQHITVIDEGLNLQYKVMKCDIQSYPESSILWQRFDIRNISTVLKLNEASITIDLKQIPAAYSCAAENLLGSARSHLAFIGVPSKPRACNASVNNTINTYVNAIEILKCCTDAFPPAYTFFWWHNNEPLETHMDTYKIVLRENSSKYFGVYSCQALNVVGNSSIISFELLPTERVIMDPYSPTVPTFMKVVLLLLLIFIVFMLGLNVFCCYKTGHFDVFLEKYRKKLKKKKRQQKRATRQTKDIILEIPEPWMTSDVRNLPFSSGSGMESTELTNVLTLEDYNRLADLPDGEIDEIGDSEIDEIGDSEIYLIGDGGEIRDCGEIVDDEKIAELEAFERDIPNPIQFIEGDLLCTFL